MSSLSLTTPALLLPTPNALRPRAADTPALSTMAGWDNMRQCARNCMNGVDYDIYGGVGCSTYECLCRPDTFAQAKGMVSACVQTDCSSNSADLASATSLFGSYCSASTPNVVAAATATGDAGGDGKLNGAQTTVTVSRTVLTSDGATVTKPVVPFVTIVDQSSQQLTNVINNGNGNGNSGNGNGNGSGNPRSAGNVIGVSSVLLCAFSLSSFLFVTALM